MLLDVPVLSVREAATVAGEVSRLRGRWIQRSEGFATVGVAAYLDIMHSRDPEATYYGRIPACNAMLQSSFGDLLERVREALAATLGRPARFEPSVALPGFHFFEDCGICTTDRPSQHFDLQHRSMRWPFGPVTDEVISFTLALQLPAQGGGLDVWDLVEDDLARLARLGRNPKMDQLGRVKPFKRHPYPPGTMAVQLRPLMHRIAAVPERLPGDRRITLQGHGVRDGDAWVLYW